MTSDDFGLQIKENADKKKTWVRVAFLFYFKSLEIKKKDLVSKDDRMASLFITFQN